MPGAQRRQPRGEERLSLDEARRIALAAQGLSGPRPVRAELRHIRQAIRSVAVLQLDPISVLCRSHYLPVLARAGPYRRAALDRLAWGGAKRELFEYWGHQASLLPLELHPFLRWRMDAARDWDWASWSWPGSRSGWRTALSPLMAAPWAVLEGMMRIGKERPRLVDEVLAVVAERGPVAAGEANPEGARSRRPKAERGAMWNWGDVKIVLEWLFYMGVVTTADRRGFERVYDLTERVLPASVLDAATPRPDEAQRQLVRVAAKANGVATERQLRDYFLLRAEHGKPRIAELVEAGELRAVRVEGVDQPMFLWHGATAPPRAQARALLSPFDSLIWNRERALQLFGFHYRTSIYTPAAERVHGYYVLPFLLGDRLVGRVDLRVDQARSALVAVVTHVEPGVNAHAVADQMAEELGAMARWLEVDRVVVEPQGDLAPVLRRAVGRNRAATGR